MSTKQNGQRGRNPADRHSQGEQHRHSNYTTADAVLYSAGTEQAALGAVMEDPSTLAILRQYLQAEDFGGPICRAVFVEMCALADKGIPYDDEVALVKALERTGITTDEALNQIHALKVGGVGGIALRARQYCLDILRDAERRVRAELQALNGEAYLRAYDSDSVAAREAPLRARLDDIKQRVCGAHRDRPLTGVISARDLMAKTFAPPVWVVPDLIAQGLTVMSGKPKMGKSWMLLALACARASGGRFLSTIDLQPGPVLYLALEDTEESLQERLRIVLQGASAPEDLTLATSAQINDWHMNMGGLERMGAWLAQHPGGSVIVDTLAKIKPAQRGNSNAYAEDYEVGARLKAIADAHNGAVILVTHNRKATAEDPLDEINATTGLMGAFDTGLIMRRERGQADAVLYVTGRRIRDAELALRFDAEMCLWSLMGDASKYATSKERAEILTAIDDLVSIYGHPARRQAIAEAVGKPSTNIGYLLTQMVKAGQIISKDGGYITPNTPNTTNTPNSANTPNETVRDTASSVRGWNDAPNSPNVSPFRMNTGTPHSAVRDVRDIRGNETLPACAYPAHREKWQWIEAQGRYVCGACHWVPDIAPVGMGAS